MLMEPGITLSAEAMEVKEYNNKCYAVYTKCWEYEMGDAESVLASQQLDTGT